MRRDATIELERWLALTKRKRGARQVGKSYLVRDFARERGLDLVELNFERDPRAAKLFADNDVAHTLSVVPRRGRPKSKSASSTTNPK